MIVTVVIFLAVVMGFLMPAAGEGMILGWVALCVIGYAINWLCGGKGGKEEKVRDGEAGAQRKGGG